MFVCFLFHQSSLVLLLMYPIYRLKLDKNKVWFLIPIIIALLLLNRFIFSSSISLLGRYGDRYASTSSTGAYGTLLLLIVFLFFSFFITDEKKITPDAKGLRNLLIIMVLIQCFAPVHSVAMRLNYYYLLFIPIIIPKMIDCRANKMSSIANMSTYVMCTFFCGYFFYKAYFGADLLQIFPYIPMWARW